MIVSANFLSIMVTIALVITALAPIVLLALWIKDLKRGQLW
jgi:hypothetical protein